ncbi:hypothetical protein C0993_010401 [Termitomyces sp. T159_Od127]|nr:hypothetical protein C0993_010401 [Termitomyces sp. T159_Od127]
MGYSARIASNPYVVGSFACIGGGLFGLDISSMSGVLTNPSYLRVFNSPGPGAQGGIVAAMPAGSLIGALMVTQLADRLGRKKTVTLAGIVWVIGSILQCASIVSNQINAMEPARETYYLLIRTVECLLSDV